MGQFWLRSPKILKKGVQTEFGGSLSLTATNNVLLASDWLFHGFWGYLTSSPHTCMAGALSTEPGLESSWRIFARNFYSF